MEIGYDNWDLTPYFPKVGGLEQLQYQQALSQDILALTEHFQQQGERVIDAATLAESVLRLEELSVRVHHILSYSECAHAEDTANEAAHQLVSKVDEICSLYSKAETLFLAQLRELSDEEFLALQCEPRLEKLAYYLERCRHQAKLSMAPELESLAADLEVTGFNAWEHLYENVAGRLEFDYRNSWGEVKHASMNSKVSLLEDSDPVVRRTTLENSNKAWQAYGDVVAACLNNIAGHRLKLLERRGVGHHLDNAAFEAGLSRRTLEAMHSAVAEYRSIPQQYLKLKAKLCGLDKLGFQDTFAPVPNLGDDRVYSWDEGKNIVLEAFRRFHPDFGGFAAMALDKHWVESEMRTGKSPGGFCTSSAQIGESRIFMTYRGNYGDVSTLAHELGHAWHEWLVRDLRQFARGYPMTLAETASTFAEQLLSDYMLSNPQLGLRQRLGMLTRRLDDAATFLLNIPMRFAFEDRFYEERRLGAVPLSRLLELMRDTQREIYGDALDANQLDPWFWASKGHFYITEISFYNFPYTFGYLFSMGVYSRAMAEGKSFLPRYVELLRHTGTDSCEGVARKALGVNLEEPDFWRESLRMIEGDWKKLNELLLQLEQ